MIIQPIRRSLTAKILLAFAAAVFVGIGSVAFLANQQTTLQFENYLRSNRPDSQRQLADMCGALYHQTGSWNVVARVMDDLSTTFSRRLVIADSSQKVIVDTSGQWVGRPASAKNLTKGQPVTVNGRIVGTLYLAPLPGSGSGATPTTPARSSLPSAVNSLSRPHPDLLSREESAFLDRVNQSLLLAAIGATAAALILAGLLARRIIRPMQDLTRSAERIAEGHFDERIRVDGEDEVATLASAFNQMAESLQQTEHARRQLVADIAHELRTPLTIIGGTVQAIRDGVLAPDDQSLTTIGDEVATLTHLVADLRDLSLGDVGQFQFRRDVVDLHRVLESVVAAFTLEATIRGTALTIDTSAKLPPVLGDEARLRQCLRNIVANALRHTPTGGQVTIQAMTKADTVQIHVSDSGEGIAVEHLPHVFERFYRADPSRARRSGGSGLGLAIVQQIVHAHGGTVSAASDGIGHGATFTVVLPVVARPVNQQATQDQLGRHALLRVHS